MAIDYNTDLGKVRLLIPDVEPVTQARNPDTGAVDYEPTLIFDDTQIDAFLSIEGGSIKRAAAAAIETIAVDEVLLSKVIKTEDLQTDGAKVANALLARARMLRNQAKEEDDEKIVGEFEIVVLSPQRSNTCIDGTFEYRHDQHYRALGL